MSSRSYTQFLTSFSLEWRERGKELFAGTADLEKAATSAYVRIAKNYTSAAEIAFQVSIAYAFIGKYRRNFLLVVPFTFQKRFLSREVSCISTKRRVVVCISINGFLCPRSCSS
jgi:hypothetical protein